MGVVGVGVGRWGEGGLPCLLAWDLKDSMRDETGPADRMLLILDSCDSAAVAGPTVKDASSSMMVSICM